jgi:hypothetical protein
MVKPMTQGSSTREGNMAGESARESARRQREKAERLQTSAELWERGADGEQATATALDALPKESWTVFHDVRWPGRKYANVDNVAVGPAGVFVIDSKNWSGTFAVRDNVLRQNGRAREEAVAGAAEAGLAVAGLTPVVVPQHVQPVLCFVRDEALTGWARDVMVCSTANLVELLSTRPEVLPPHILIEARLQLDAMFRSATDPLPRHSVSTAARHAPPRRAPVGSPTIRQNPRTATTRPPARRSAPSRRSRKSDGGLIKAAIALVAVFVLIGSPQVLTSVSEGLTKMFTSGLVDGKAPAIHPSDKPRKHKSPKDPADRRTTNTPQP